MTKTNTTTAPIHPGQVWRTVIEDVEMTQSQVAEKMGCSVAGLSRILRKAGVPSAPLVIAFSEATDSSVQEMWQVVADYELAKAFAARKPAKVVKTTTSKIAKAAAPAKRTQAKRTTTKKVDAAK